MSGKSDVGLTTTTGRAAPAPHDRRGPRPGGIVRAAADPDALPTARVLRMAGCVLEAIWTGDGEGLDRLCAEPESCAFMLAELPGRAVGRSALLQVGGELRSVEVHLDHVLYHHPSIAASFRVAARSNASPAQRGRAADDVTVRGALFGVLGDDEFISLQLIRDSAVVRTRPVGDAGLADGVVREH